MKLSKLLKIPLNVALKKSDLIKPLTASVILTSTQRKTVVFFKSKSKFHISLLRIHAIHK